MYGAYQLLSRLIHKTNFPVFVGIIDDETDLVCLFKDALSNIADVRAFGFTDPKLALVHFRDNHEKYKCIISDYRMPSMNGIEFLEQAKEINAGVARILISAFDIADQAFRDCQCVDKFLQKPIRISDLIEQVQKCLISVEIEKQNLE